MKIEVNLNRKFLVFGILIGLIILGFVGVYAYTPAVYGHSPNELDWTETVRSNVLINGSTGMGTGYPGAKLHINGTGYAGVFVENTGKKFSFYANNNGNLIIGDEVAGIARIIVNGTTGNVGIGTASPDQKLVVSGAVKATNIVATSGVNASTICLAGDCQTSWPAGGGGGTVSYANCGWQSKYSCTDLTCVITCSGSKFVKGYKLRVSNSNVKEVHAYCCDIVVS